MRCPTPLRRGLVTLTVITALVITALGAGPALAQAAAFDPASEVGRLDVALDRDPGNPLLYIQRAGLLQQLHAQSIGPERRRELFQRIVADFRQAIARSPDNRIRAIARDALAEVEGRTLAPPPEVDCQPAAMAEYEAAEALFSANRYEEALARYRQATSLCPDSPPLWINYGDAYFALGQYERAAQLLEHGLDLDPWNRVGNRFLADSAGRLGNREGAYRAALRAVLSDPSYEAGWATLREIVVSSGGQWRRVYAEKPAVSITDGGRIAIELSPELLAAGALEPTLPWALFALARAQALSATSLAQLPDAERALTREREVVRRTLGLIGELPPSAEPDPTRLFWRQIEEADQAGLLDEAIFVHLLDRDLLAAYLDYRRDHADRLFTYLESLLAPLPTAAERTPLTPVDPG